MIASFKRIQQLRDQKLLLLARTTMSKVAFLKDYTQLIMTFIKSKDQWARASALRGKELM
jgi:hypothetical protein